MTAVAAKIKKSAEANDVAEYYKAVYEFSAVGLSAEKNKMRKQIILDLLPAIRRIHFIALLRQTHDLLENASYFQHLTRYMNEKDPDGGERVMRSYIENEKKVALAAIRKL